MTSNSVNERSQSRHSSVGGVVYRDPVKDLHPHALVKAVPRWALDDPEFQNFSNDIFVNGIKNPIKITKDNQVIDGETRRLAAKKRGLTQIPCVVVPDDEVFQTIVRELAFRRQLTKSGLAYSVYPILAPAFEEARHRMLKQPRSAQHALLPKTIEELAETVGVSRRLFFQAQEVHKAFREDEALRAQFEPTIISGDTALGAVIAGIAGQKSTKGKSKPEDDQLELWEDGLTTIEKRFRYWTKFDAEQKDVAAKAIRKVVAQMPQDVRKEFAKAIRAVEREENR